MENFTFYVGVCFTLITFLAVLTFYKSVPNTKWVLPVVSIWILFQISISLLGFYTLCEVFAVKLIILVLPPVVLIARIFLSKSGEAILSNINVHLFTVIHIIRAPLELLVYWLFITKVVPVEMTFAGGNPDMFCGVLVPVIYYYGILKGEVKWQLLAVWNVIGLGLMINMVIKMFVFTPFFTDPNSSVKPDAILLQFPFVLLSSVLIPIFLFAHLAMIRYLFKTYGYAKKVEFAGSQLIKGLPVDRIFGYKQKIELLELENHI